MAAGGVTMRGIFDFLLRRDTRRRTPRQETGRAGEQAAEAFLKKHGYRILDRNVTYRQGEVDLVAQEKATGTLCFVEVRSRAAPAGDRLPVQPEETVTLRKRRRIISATRKFLADRRVMDVTVRFDVIAIRFDGDDRRRPDIRHYPAAFDANGRLT